MGVRGATVLRVRPALPKAVLWRRPADPLPFPLAEPECRAYPRGRDAIGEGLRALDLAPGAQALVPAYHPRAGVEALIRAGLEPRFYEGDERLEPRADELAAMLGPRVRALVLIHYLGFPQDSPRWRRFCDEHNLNLIEDAAHAWLASVAGAPVGSLADLAVFSFHEVVGLPRAALLARRPPPVPVDPRGLDLLRERALSGLLARVADPSIAIRRRTNFETLLERLAEQVPLAFRELPRGASPLGLPIETADKRELQSRLASRGVHALDLWPDPHPSLVAAQHPDARRRRERTLVIPAHQELGPAELDRVVSAMRPAAPRAREPRLTPIADLDAEADDVRELAERADNIFATPEWLSGWWRRFGSGEQRIAGWRDADGVLRGLVPLYRTRIGGMRALRFLGHGPGDQLGPVCAAGDRVALGRAIRRGLEDGLFGAWDLLLGEQLLAEDGWSARLGAGVLRRESSPVLRAEGRSFDEVLASRSKNFRQQVRGRERKLRREHELAFRLCEDPGRLQVDLETLFELHAARWRGGVTTAFSSERQAFHRGFAASALERGWLRLWIAEVDGTAVAALYGFRFAGNELYYQSGRDPAWDERSVGFILLSHSIRMALDEGVDEYRLLRGDEPYKLRFASGDPGLETCVAGRGAAARVALAAAGPLAELDPTPRWLRRVVG